MQKQFLSCEKYKLEKSEKLYKKSFCLPSSTNLKLSDIEKVISLVF